MDPHDAADPLLIDALRSGWRKMHDDCRARRVPAFGEQHRVHEHVDLGPLVRREDLRELDRRRAPGDRLRLDTGSSERGRQVVGVVDAGRVDDARRVAEALAVERRGGHVQRLVVERLCERALLEVAANDRHLVDRSDRRHAQAAERRDQPTSRGVCEREVVDRGGKDV